MGSRPQASKIREAHLTECHRMPTVAEEGRSTYNQKNDGTAGRSFYNSSNSSMLFGEFLSDCSLCG